MLRGSREAVNQLDLVHRAMVIGFASIEIQSREPT